jgi:hypothetical protein
MMLIPGGLSGIRTHLRLAPRHGARGSWVGYPHRFGGEHVHSSQGRPERTA